MKIKYVGVKEDGETAFHRETGITWMPGSAHEVPDHVAAKMLNHPDVFAKAEDAPAKTVKAGKESAKDTGSTSEATSSITLAPGAAIGAADPLAGLDDAGVRAFAKQGALKINGIGLFKGDKLRAKVREALAAIPAPK